MANNCGPCCESMFPDQFKVRYTVGDGNCSYAYPGQCAIFAATDYIFNRTSSTTNPCVWFGGMTGCNYGSAQISIGFNTTTGKYYAALSINDTGPGTGFLLEQDDPIDCLSALTLPATGSGTQACTFASALLTPMAPNTSTANATDHDCLPATNCDQTTEDEGSNGGSACGPGGGGVGGAESCSPCGGGSGGGGSDSGGPGSPGGCGSGGEITTEEAAFANPLWFMPAGGSAPCVSAFPSFGGYPAPPRPQSFGPMHKPYVFPRPKPTKPFTKPYVLPRPRKKTKREMIEVLKLAGEAADGACGTDVNLATGALSVSTAPPSSAPNDAQPFLAYSTFRMAAGPFGHGWTGQHRQSIAAPSTDVAVLSDATGGKRYYIGKDSNGRYWTPGLTANTLQKNGDNTYTETTPEGDEWRYDTSGKLTRKQDLAGNRWTMVYSGSLLVAVRAPYSRRTTYAYDGSNKLKRITDPDGRITSYTVDGSGDLTQITTPELCVTSLRYDGAHRLTGMIFPGGQRQTVNYDASGRVKAGINPTGGRTTFAYLDWLTARVTDPSGGITTTLFNVAKNPAGYIDTTGARSTMVWGSNRLQASIDGNGRRTTFTYRKGADRKFTPRSSVDADGFRATVVYDGSDRPVGRIDQKGNRTTLVLDGSGRVKSSISPVGYRQTMILDAAGQPISFISAEGGRGTLVYDALGRTRAVIDPLGSRTTFGYTANSQVRMVQDALGRTSTFAYDSVNRLVWSADALGDRTTQLYNASCQPSATVSPLGQRWTTLYDGNLRPQASIDPLGNRTSVAYDKMGNVVRQVDGAGRISTVLYDARQNVKASMDPLGNRTTFAYDKAGNRTSVTDPMGRRSTVLYDALSRPAASIDPLGNRTTMRYDAVSQPVATINPRGYRSTTRYDAAQRPISTINALGQRTTTVYTP